MLGVEVKAPLGSSGAPSLPLLGHLLSTPVSLGAISPLPPPPTTGIHAPAFSSSHFLTEIQSCLLFGRMATSQNI